MQSTNSVGYSTSAKQNYSPKRVTLKKPLTLYSSRITTISAIRIARVTNTSTSKVSTMSKSKS